MAITMGFTEGDFVYQLEKAADRIGRGNLDGIRWLLRYAQEDLPSLSIDDWHRKAFELAYFVRFGPSNPRYKIHVPLRDQWSRPGIGPFTIPSRQEAIALQEVVSNHLTEILKGFTKIEITDCVLSFQ